MKNMLHICILCLFIFAIGCNSAAPSGVEGPGKVPQPSETIPSKDRKVENVPIQLVVGEDFEVGKTRTWKLSEGGITIYADMTGDGRLDDLKVDVIYDTELDAPTLDKKDDRYVLSWPYAELAEILIGDVDQDGDADIVLDLEKKCFLINDSDIHVREPLSPESIESLIQEVSALVSIGNISEAFQSAVNIALGTPHNWGVPGEGPSGRFDRDAEYDFEIGNCVTWVEQIMAMLGSDGSLESFYDRLINIRYEDGVKEYAMRNHFQAADWIPNNIEAGFIHEVSFDAESGGLPHVEGVINKKNWYAAKSSLEGDFSDLNEVEYALRLSEFRLFGAFFPPEEVSLSYYPFDKMIIEDGDGYILDQGFVESLPDISIFNLVNKGLNLKMPSTDEALSLDEERAAMNKEWNVSADEEGEWMTDLIVTHVGFLIKTPDGGLMVYNSTPMTDTALSIMSEEDYISFLVHHRYIDNPDTTAVGLHISSSIIIPAVAGPQPGHHQSK